MSGIARALRRLTDYELFHIRGPEGLEAISDETLERRLSEAERRALREAIPAYPELLEHPEVT